MARIATKTTEAKTERKEWSYRYICYRNTKIEIEAQSREKATYSNTEDSGI